MTEVKEKTTALTHNDNLKGLKPFGSKKSVSTEPKTPSENTKPNISKESKVANDLKTDPSQNKLPDSKIDSADAALKAESIASSLAKVPVLPIATPKLDSKIEKKLADIQKERIHFIKKPAVIFIEGFSAFGISNGDGIRDMADNFPGAKRFDWTDKEKIVEEIKKHTPDQPVVLVGHSFGGDTAVEVAEELNSAKNLFRPVDLLISLDSVGFNNTIIPMNVKRNLNFFQEGVVPFLHGNPTVARNTDYTEITNELRTELHSRIDDSPEVQFKIFESINETIGQAHDEPNIVIQLDLSNLIDNQLSSLKKESN